MRVYLDNCCFNRPFDEQKQIKIRLETEAKLNIQTNILRGKYELAWSYILDYENLQNPYNSRKDTIQKWKDVAIVDCDENDYILELALKFEKEGLKSKDALHVACAIFTKSDYFITTDQKILNKNIAEIIIINPIDFVRKPEVNANDE